MIAHPPEGALSAAAAVALVFGAAVTIVWFRGRSQRARRQAWFTAAGLVALALSLGWSMAPVVGRPHVAAAVQHVALMVVAPALLCAGRAQATLAATARELGLLGHPRRPRRSAWWRGRETAVLVGASAVHAVVLTLWHLPAVFAATADDLPGVVAIGEHATMVAAGTALFAAWTSCARRAPRAAAVATTVAALNGAAVTVLLAVGGLPAAGVVIGAVVGSTYAALAVLTLDCPHATALLPDPTRGTTFRRQPLSRGLTSRPVRVPG